jgi:hypothetical protein
VLRKRGRWDTCVRRETGLNLARQVIIYDHRLVADLANHFPRVTKLTLAFNGTYDNYLCIADLNRILPLAQLTELVFEWSDTGIFQLLEFLRLAPNVHSLTFYEGILMPTDRSEIARLMPNNNITKVTIKDGSHCTLKHVQRVFVLFPRLRCIEIATSDIHDESIVRFLLLKNTITNSHQHHHLFSLCLRYGSDERMKKLQTIIDCEKLLDDYSLLLVKDKVYLWW